MDQHQATVSLTLTRDNAHRHPWTALANKNKTSVYGKLISQSIINVLYVCISITSSDPWPVLQTSPPTKEKTNIICSNQVICEEHQYNASMS